jgi:cobalt-zinc-cadmium efflux system protein
MGHVHGHTHDHHAGAAIGRAFGVGIALNLGLIVFEVVFGLIAQSTALLADAAHNSSDVLGLVLAWGASVLARRRATRRHTYGLRGTTVLAALANAVLLIATVGGVAWEAIGRLRSPAEVECVTVMIVAAVGVVINGGSAIPFLRASRNDQNLRGAFLHLMADAAISAAVVVAGALVWQTGQHWIDPAVCLGISAIILLATWGLLRDALRLALHGVPERVDMEALTDYLKALPGVEQIHDLHVWAMSTTETALTVHLVMAQPASVPTFLRELEVELKQHFCIDHMTVQIDPSAAEPCGLAVPDALCSRARN